MSAFDESNVRRGQPANAGQFRTKTSTAPSGTLAPAEPDADALGFAHFDELTDSVASDAIWAVGEMGHRRAQLARDTQDPNVLAQLAHETTSDAPTIVASHPHTSPATLHYLATNTDRSHLPENRGRAIAHPNVAVATIRAVWDRRRESIEARYAATSVVLAPNAPTEIIDAAFEEHVDLAGGHRSLSREILDAAARDPLEVVRVIGNPNLTEAQLDHICVMDIEGAHLDAGDDAEYAEIRALVALRDVARHPNTGTATLAHLARHKDRWVVDAAHDRLTSASGDA